MKPARTKEQEESRQQLELLVMRNTRLGIGEDNDQTYR